MSNLINPSHYSAPGVSGVELIDFIDHLPFARGNAIKYVFRAGRKDASTELQDLQKAQWLINREVMKLTNKGAK
jgi:hypothetical protein